ncbi:ATP-binding protein [Candidatus Phytoplasma solani]|uniref:ATP-binding protein n=1 Tax=Candidatus Phytoplasma solani TaxID=69896 RepID=UPI0032DB442E
MLLTVVAFVFGAIVYIDHLQSKSQPESFPESQPPNQENETPAGGRGNLGSFVDLFTPPETNYENFPGFDEIHGLKEPIERLKEISHRFNPKNANYYNQISPENPMSFPKGVLFYGPPGTGKTLLAECFAKESEMNFYIITPKHTLEEIENIFKRARKNSPAIIFADEAEEIIKSRTSKMLEEGDTKKTDLLLAEIDGVKTDKENPVFFMGATNHKDKVDSAILSRLESIYIGYFSENERLDFVKLMFKKKTLKVERHALNEYLPILMQKFNFALEHPEMFAIALKHGYYIPALGKTEIKGTSDKTHPYGNLSSINDELNHLQIRRDYACLQSPSINDKAYNLEDLEKIKVHFYDLLSGRKLEMLVENAGYKAALNNHNQILISDLEEAFKDFFGYQKEFNQVNQHPRNDSNNSNN